MNCIVRVILKLSINEKRNLVIVPFPFTDLTSNKRRPACVLLPQGRDVMLAFITTKLFYEPKFSVQLLPSEENGLKRESIIRIDKITTLDADLVLGKLGEITPEKIAELNHKIIDCYQLRND
jgi:mRNA interferase MazF